MIAALIERWKRKRAFRRLLATCQDLVKNGATDEELLRHLRSRGAHQGDSIQAMMDLKGLDFPRAKALVHYSATWDDLRDATEEIEELFDQALTEWAVESGGEVRDTPFEPELQAWFARLRAAADERRRKATPPGDGPANVSPYEEDQDEDQE